MEGVSAKETPSMGVALDARFLEAARNMVQSPQQWMQPWFVELVELGGWDLELTVALILACFKVCVFWGLSHLSSLFVCVSGFLGLMRVVFMLMVCMLFSGLQILFFGAACLILFLGLHV